MAHYDLTITLEGTEPTVHRRFLLTTRGTFHDLHDAIQRATGWEDRHLYEFRAHPTQVVIAGVPDEDAWDDTPPAPDARKVKLADWFGQGRKRATYEYDFGDGWLVEVVCNGIVDDDTAGKRKLIDGARAFPPEDCGGLQAYERCATFVRTGKDPWGEDDTLGEWLGAWHPDQFDLAAARRRFDARPPAQRKSIVVDGQAPRTSPPANEWTKALNVALPSLADIATKRTLFGSPRLGDVVLAALLARGAPSTESQLAADLVAAGITSDGDLGRSIRRSLGAADLPILRDHEGRLTPDLRSDELDLRLFVMGLRPAHHAPQVTPRTASDPSGPLTRADVDDAFTEGLTASDSKARFTCAVLDAHGGPLTIDELAARWHAYGARAAFGTVDLRHLAKRSELVVDGEHIRLADDADIEAIRAGVRERARAVRDRRDHQEQSRASNATYAARRQEEEAAASSLRRVAIAAVRDGAFVIDRRGAPDVAAADTTIECFDFVARESRTFSPQERAAFASFVASFEVVAGVRPHQTLSACGVDPQRFVKLADVLPSQKTVSVDGRQVPVRRKDVVRGTTHTEDVDPLAAVVGLYRFALLHAGVWLRVGDQHVVVRTDVHAKGDQNAWTLLKAAVQSGDVVSLFVGTIPEALPRGVVPLRAVVRGRVLGIDGGMIVVQDAAGRIREVPLIDVTAIDRSGGTDLAWRI